MKLDLKEKPFYLNDDQIDFIEKKIEKMTLNEKIGQLFFPINYISDEKELKKFIQEYQPAGSLNRPNCAKVNQNLHRLMQESSKIPMLIAANIESGGNGAAAEGTAFGNPLQVAATGNPEYARKLGLIAGREGRALGVNYAFAPIIDIDNNSLNPITNTRTFGNNPDTVLSMASAYIEGLMEDGRDMCYSIKHFPGDGVDYRDQHLHTTYNTLSPEQWESSYGRNYRTLIEKGAPTVMVGHIGLPEYVRSINPRAGKKELLTPGSLSKEIMTGLLRERMNFNGLIISDASNMNGFCDCMSREKAVPTAIANGCDILLFNINIEEDREFMKQGIDNGLLRMERVNDAIRRTLALKMSIGLFEKQAKGTLVPGNDALKELGKQEYQEQAEKCAD
jgi:beta-N-acetylhexosaminidase